MRTGFLLRSRRLRIFSPDIPESMMQRSCVRSSRMRTPTGIRLTFCWGAISRRCPTVRRMPMWAVTSMRRCRAICTSLVLTARGIPTETITGASRLMGRAAAMLTCWLKCTWVARPSITPRKLLISLAKRYPMNKTNMRTPPALVSWLNIWAITTVKMRKAATVLTP
ncbi:MAG: hypothetical protein BWY57_01975 [Betaproteobacteria bacterium ADurb.Bin341]|nr:MAG: hypothetical protein BWY57_01975 [Betaproteobacteria bacterium ADurb.Bin341]